MPLEQTKTNYGKNNNRLKKSKEFTRRYPAAISSFRPSYLPALLALPSLLVLPSSLSFLRDGPSFSPNIISSRLFIKFFRLITNLHQLVAGTSAIEDLESISSRTTEHLYLTLAQNTGRIFAQNVAHEVKCLLPAPTAQLQVLAASAGAL